MGEVAEMMLDGTLCDCCGTYLGEAEGFPKRCDDCAEPEQPKPKKPKNKRKPAPKEAP